MEVVVVGEFSAAVDVFESKETNPVHPIHWPARQKHNYFNIFNQSKPVISYEMCTIQVKGNQNLLEEHLNYSLHEVDDRF